MPEEPGTDAAAFIRQIRGNNGEFASLLYLAAALGARGKGANVAGASSEEQLQTINLLKTRIAELCRLSEKKMRRAAVSLSQIGKVLEGEQGSGELAKRFEPVRLLLQQQIDHSRRSVQVGMRAVNELNGLTAAPDAGESKARSGAAKTARPVALKRAAKKGARKQATKKRATKRSAGAATAPGSGNTAATD